ncbi:c-type cytochrome [Ramlibacter sp.]|uniref:c-type cytochrome n=1 Tax=Ramlibacter sp. TaxID=1917967 RepID=UPI003D139C03
MLRFLLALALSAAALSSGAAPAFEDSMAQRTRACTICHGKEGRAGPDGYYPRIAGKPAGYLYNQLLNFRDGRRHYALMTRLLDPLSDAYLLEIANHFAGLDLPYAQPPRSALANAALERGQALAMQGDALRGLPACASCHGAALTGVLPNTPGLLGLPRDYLSAQMGAWRSGQRRAHAPDCMADIARRLGADDMQAVIGWIASQPVPAAAKPVAALAKPAPVACGSAALPAGRQAP